MSEEEFDQCQKEWTVLMYDIEQLCSFKTISKDAKKALKAILQNGYSIFQGEKVDRANSYNAYWIPVIEIICSFPAFFDLSGILFYFLKLFIPQRMTQTENQYEPEIDNLRNLLEALRDKIDRRDQLILITDLSFCFGKVQNLLNQIYKQNITSKNPNEAYTPLFYYTSLLHDFITEKSRWDFIVQKIFAFDTKIKQIFLKQYEVSIEDGAITKLKDLYQEVIISKKLEPTETLLQLKPILEEIL